MVIEDTKYQLNSSNYYQQGTKKKKIVLGNTFNTDMKHYIGWAKRFNGQFIRTAMFTIKLDGTIHQHFSPIYFSDFVEYYNNNEEIISIVLENEGWLKKGENNTINYLGHIYNREDDIIIKKWRNKNRWAPYSIEQLESSVELVKELCEEFDIPLEVASHNTKMDHLGGFTGILYRANFETYFTDVNPSWYFSEFKNKIETK